jgi:sugar transferase (PEP-CTERM system associated)
MKSPVVVEIFLLILAICFSAFIQVQELRFSLYSAVILSEQIIFPAVIVIISFYYCNLFDLRLVRNFGEFLKQLPLAFGVASIFLYSFYVFFPVTSETNDPLFSCLLLVYAVLSVVLPVRLVLYHFMKTHAFRERVVILGTGPIARKISEAIEANPHVGYKIIGFVDDRRASSPSASQSSKYVVIGSIDRLHEILDERQPDRIIIALGERRGCLPVKDLLNARMTGCIVEDAIEVHERLTKKLAIESLPPSYLLFSEDFAASRLRITLRRLASLTFAIVGLILTVPLMILIAVAVKLDSNGPVLFIQDRCGWRGRTFRLFKFRTMHPVQPGMESKTVWERDDSSRVTRVGKWLRKLKLDELPQFINVLFGDMDLIGPRPEMASNVQTMLKEIPYYSLRMGVRPGITGWAQVRHGYSVSQEDVTEKMRYDLYYVKHMSLWLDLRILLDTMKIILLGRNSEKSVHTIKETHQPLYLLKEMHQPQSSSIIVNLLQSEKPTRNEWNDSNQ